MGPSPMSRVNSGALCILLSMVVLLCTSEGEISIDGTLEHGHSRFVRFTCSFPATSEPGHMLALYRRVYTDTVFRTITITNRTRAARFFRISTSMSALTFNGSIIFTLQEAHCLDAGVYQCQSLVSPRPNYFRPEETSNMATLEMIPSNPRLLSRPLLLDFKHMIPGTLIKLECIIFSTVSVQGGWIWETAFLPNVNWSRIPDTMWVEGKVPEMPQRCYFPWKSTLTMEVSEDDVDRLFRCHVRYRYQNLSHNSTYAVYSFMDHQMNDSPSRVMLSILAMACGTSIVIIGGVLTVRSFTSHFPEFSSRTLSRIRRFCRRCPLRRHRHSRSSGAVSRRRFSELMVEFGSQTPPASSGEGSQAKEEGSHQDGGGDTSSRDWWSEDDAPGAEDDWWQDDMSTEVVEGVVEGVVQPEASPPPAARELSALSAASCQRSLSPTATSSRCGGHSLSSAVPPPPPCLSKPRSEMCMSTEPLTRAVSNISAPNSSTALASADTTRLLSPEPRYGASSSSAVLPCAAQASDADLSLILPSPPTSSAGALTPFSDNDECPLLARSQTLANAVPSDVSKASLGKATPSSWLGTMQSSPPAYEETCSAVMPRADWPVSVVKPCTLPRSPALPVNHIPFPSTSNTRSSADDPQTSYACSEISSSAKNRPCDDDIMQLVSALPSPPNSEKDE